MTLNCVFYTIYPPPPYWRVSCHCRENQKISEWGLAQSDAVQNNLSQSLLLVWCDLISHWPVFLTSLHIHESSKNSNNGLSSGLWAEGSAATVHQSIASPADSSELSHCEAQGPDLSRLQTHLEASLWDYGGKQWPSGGAFFSPDLCGQSFTNDHRMVAATAARPQSTLNTQPIALRLKSYYLKVNPCIIHNECIMFLLLPNKHTSV